MPIPPGKFVLSEFSGPEGTPVGSGFSVYLVDNQYGFIECGRLDTQPTYVAPGIRLQSIGDDDSYTQFDNSLLTHAGPLVVPTGLGMRFRPEARRVDIDLGRTSGSWGVMANMGLNPSFWDFPDAVFDFDFTEPLYFHTGLDIWYEFALLATGYWCLATDGVTVLEGNIGPAPDTGYWYMGARASSSVDDTDGQVSVDKMWLYGVAAQSAVRLFPRDDGRGMSSAPRAWPPPKSQRVIGGHQ